MVERIMKRKIDNNDLTHYFIRDHRELPASYLKSCEKFFKQIRKENHERNKKEKKYLDDALMTSIAGISAAMKNTG